MDHPERYENITVTFKALMCHSKKFKGIDCPGRFAMVCCDKDKQFLALVCKGEGLDRFKDRDWVKLRAAVKVEDCPAYEGPGRCCMSARSAPARRQIRRSYRFDGKERAPFHQKRRLRCAPCTAASGGAATLRSARGIILTCMLSEK